MCARNSFCRDSLLRGPAVRETAGISQFAVLVPVLHWSVRHQSEKAPLQIARLWFGVPGGLHLFLALRPELCPNTPIVFQIMLPRPKCFAVRRPKCFVAGFASADVSHFVLFRAVLVEVSFRTVEQVAAIRANPRAPLRPHFSIGEIFRKLL